jgi:glycosyltransferase involved in cell wall biosynthesis
VTIGLPVYNGDAFLEESIESLVTQTYRDFELLISDNASTDRTEEICRRYAAQDPRVKYWRNDHNIGGMRNANLTVERARGEFFRWAAHDDVCAPTMLERLVAELDATPDVALCCTAATWIDAKGVPMPEFIVGEVLLGRRSGNRKLVTDDAGIRYPTEGTGADATERYRELLYLQGPCEATYGLMRTDVLRDTVLLGDYTASDTVFLCDLALRTRFQLVPEPLFWKRWHPANRYRERGPGRMVWSRPELAESGRPTCPRWSVLRGHLIVVRRAPMPWRERVGYLPAVARWAWLRRRSLAADLWYAAVMVAHSKEWRRERYSPEHWTEET